MVIVTICLYELLFLFHHNKSINLLYVPQVLGKYDISEREKLKIIPDRFSDMKCFPIVQLRHRVKSSRNTYGVRDCVDFVKWGLIVKFSSEIIQCLKNIKLINHTSLFMLS